MTKILSVKNLVIKFYTFDGVVHALNNVSFDLEEGETLAIVGESGSGKSVSMLSLLHLLPMPPAKIENGEAYFYGNEEEPVDLLKLNRSGISKIRGGKIGFIFQDALSALNPVMTIGRQISESIIEHLGLSHAKAKEKTIELLKRVGIPGARQRYDNFPHQFSGGMRQRVMIAMALSCNPRLMLADEPTTALDVTIQAQILDLLKRIERGDGKEAYISMLERMCKHLWNAYCAFAPGAVAPVESLLKYFADEVREHISLKKCPFKVDS